MTQEKKETQGPQFKDQNTGWDKRQTFTPCQNDGERRKEHHVAVDFYTCVTPEPLTAVSPTAVHYETNLALLYGPFSCTFHTQFDCIRTVVNLRRPDKSEREP